VKDFVFWVTFGCGIELVFRLISYATVGRLPERTAFAGLIDGLIALGIVVWGVRLLA
jgi:hypothetical protein